MQVLLNIPEKKAAFVMEMLRHFKYVKTEPMTEQKTPGKRSKDALAKDIRSAYKKAKDYEEGKIQLQRADEALADIRREIAAEFQTGT